MQFVVEKMFKLPDAGNLKAFADVCCDDILVIRGCRIVEGKKGLFVSMPQEQGKDNKWYDQVVIKRADTYEAFARAVLSFYNGENIQALNE